MHDSTTQLWLKNHHSYQSIISYQVIQHMDLNNGNTNLQGSLHLATRYHLIVGLSCNMFWSRSQPHPSALTVGRLLLLDCKLLGPKAWQPGFQWRAKELTPFVGFFKQAPGKAARVLIWSYNHLVCKSTNFDNFANHKMSILPSRSGTLSDQICVAL